MGQDRVKFQRLNQQGRYGAKMQSISSLPCTAVVCLPHYTCVPPLLGICAQLSVWQISLLCTVLATSRARASHISTALSAWCC